MTGHLLLDWVALAISLFNTILLLWLGLTVFLNAERRVWGIWAAAAGLLLGALFFISHSAILGEGVSRITPGLNFWWHTGWIPVAALPLAWYAVMLWYSGFWRAAEASGSTHQANAGRLSRRHRLWFALTLVAGLAWIGLLLFANPLPSISQLSAGSLAAEPAVAGVPLLVLAYPVYTLLCIVLSLDALNHPEPSGRLLGDRARARARGWFIAVSLLLLAVSLLVGWVMVWLVRSSPRDLLAASTVEVLGWFDLVIEALIAAAVVLLGQAVVTYEVFTGKSLPRRGLARYWRRALVLAAGFSLALAGSLALELRPVYSILLSMLVMVVFYALLGWRDYAERERLIQSLRPFVAHQRLYRDILEAERSPKDGGSEELEQPFHALCAGILEAGQACLVPLGALAPLSGGALVYPEGSRPALPDLAALAARLDSPAELGVPLEAGHSGEMVFAVSLWNERGLIGVLLLGEKQTGGLYTQEEMEIARAVGEHLLDTRAGLEMARRLVSLQRQRLAQSQVLDQQTRRVIHDEILPLVHTSLLGLNGLAARPDGPGSELIPLLEEAHHRLADLLRSGTATTSVEVRSLGLLGALRKTVEVDLHRAFDRVDWDIPPGVERSLGEMPNLVAEVLFFALREALRNAANHGRRNRPDEPLCLAIRASGEGGLSVSVEDNGPGLAADREKQDGKGGSGQGLALHSTLLAVIGGELAVDSAAGQYTRVTVSLPAGAWESWE